ncbi:MAG: biopolymer transporter ExbD [Bacteroidales bacterium]|nr:biopolymer transporter ExbD [Bacteroidales bacterium]MBQ7213758.1 biopolymer transporter ExbD [Bacteroidales bacterium]MCR5714126.1 biopolymer transporter ExbD [Bacteroidales bacterium]
MAIKTSNRINASFSMSSMTDLVFLLLIFFMITSTLVSPNALKLLLPQANNQTAAKPATTVSITRDIHYYIETTPVEFSDLERQLQLKLMDEDDPTISLHIDKSVPVEYMTKVMVIAKNNKWKLILATAPEK